MEKKRHFRHWRALFAVMIGLAAFLFADGGATVTQAKLVMCYNCGGTGQKSCPLCGGTGRTMRQVMDPITMMFTTQFASCMGCGGSGKTICSTCGGSGRWEDGTVDTGTSGGSGSSGTGSNSNSGTSSGASSETGTSSNKVKYATVIDATEGVWSGECAPNLFDDDKNTKFNVKATSAYVIWKAPKLMQVSSYVIMTGNDNATYKGRNPKSWVLYGSSKILPRDSKSWKKLHSVTNDKKLKDKNYTNYTYKLKSAAKAYQYYKLEIKDNKGADCTQMTAFTLKGKTVTSKATALSSVKKSKTSMKLKWKKQKGVTGYQYQYSTSSSFKSGTKVTVKGAAKVSATVKKLKKDKNYYVRIRTYRKVNGSTVYSSWSKKVRS